MSSESHLANIIWGVLLGFLAGGGIELGVCIYLFDKPPFFNGDTVSIGAIICGVLGFFLSEGFIVWLKESIG